MRTLLSTLLLLVFMSPLHAKIVGKQVQYEYEGTKLTGYLAYDDSQKGKRPGILVVHEWWGHNDYARNRAKQLAGLGYVAFALDMYGDGKLASHPKDAGRFAGQVKNNMPAAEGRFTAARTQLLAYPGTDANNIAAIGYCFGGGVVLEMARRGHDLKGVVSFHGSLSTSQPAVAGKMTAKVLVLNGADDPFVKPEQIAEFRKEMKQAKVDMQFISLANAKHAFTNPAATALGKKFNLPLAYNKAADKKSWQAMQEFFKNLFK